jgi:hypothetical protein
MPAPEAEFRTKQKFKLEESHSALIEEMTAPYLKKIKS